MIFSSRIAYSSNVNPASIQQLNGFLFYECRRNGFNFENNRTLSEIDLWTDAIHLIESGKRIIANNLINILIYESSQLVSLSENTLSSEKTRTSKLNSEKLDNSKLRLRNVNKVLIGNLNIDSSRNKFDQLKDTVLKHIDVLISTETKLETFLIPQFLMDGVSKPYRFDRNKHGGGVMVYIRDNSQ